VRVKSFGLLAIWILIQEKQCLQEPPATIPMPEPNAAPVIALPSEEE
jgi:hypothetical protein